MKKRDFETCRKRFRDFEILPKFSETHVFRGTIRHPYTWLFVRVVHGYLQVSPVTKRFQVGRYMQ